MTPALTPHQLPSWGSRGPRRPHGSPPPCVQSCSPSVSRPEPVSPLRPSRQMPSPARICHCIAFPEAPARAPAALGDTECTLNPSRSRCLQGGLLPSSGFMSTTAPVPPSLLKQLLSPAPLGPRCRGTSPTHPQTMVFRELVRGPQDASQTWRRWQVVHRQGNVTREAGGVTVAAGTTPGPGSGRGRGGLHFIPPGGSSTGTGAWGGPGKPEAHLPSAHYAARDPHTPRQPETWRVPQGAETSSLGSYSITWFVGALGLELSLSLTSMSPYPHTPRFHTPALQP